MEVNRQIYRKKCDFQTDQNYEERMVTVKSYLKGQQWSSDGITEGVGIESTTVRVTPAARTASSNSQQLVQDVQEWVILNMTEVKFGRE